jgi:sugar phosphate isomerase/epimerase
MRLMYEYKKLLYGDSMKLIPIGTLVDGKNAIKHIPQIFNHGFECFSIFYFRNITTPNLEEDAKRIRNILGEAGLSVSSVSIFSNPLVNDGAYRDSVLAWERLIDCAPLFGTNMVTGFTGRIPDKPIPESLPKFKEVFTPLAARARDKGVRLAFENCPMGGNWTTGDWNIAHNAACWELMFQELNVDNLGLEWEPCHQMTQLIDPIPQLRKWVNKVFHVHGKDATIEMDTIREYGICGEKPFVWHRTPGFGDSNWKDIITILMQNNYTGTIDIEGFHDPVFARELEMTGQVASLNYLKQCRGGAFIPNPV